MTIVEQKNGLRKTVLAARRAMSETARAEQSAALATKLFALPTWQAAQTVALYASMPDEVGTDDIITRARETGKQVLLPRVAGPGQLVWHQVLSLDELELSSLGIREPRAGALRVGLAYADLVLVPGVAFDLVGNRLGYGGGFYDRALAGYSGDTIALVYACQCISSLDADTWDVPVSSVISYP